MLLSISQSPMTVLSIVACFFLQALVSSSITAAFQCSCAISSYSTDKGSRIHHHHRHPHHRSGVHRNLHLQQYDDHGDLESRSTSSSTTTTDRRTALGNTLWMIASTTSSLLMTITTSATIASAAEANTNTKSLSEEYRQGTAALGNTDTDSETIPRSSYITLPSGVIYADISTGNNGGGGEESAVVVKEGSTVNLQWVLRRSNGYFVDSSAVSDSIPFIFKVGSGNAIAGLDEGVRGMKVGGSRRILIPPKLAYVQGVEDGKPGPLPVGYGPKRQITRVMEVRRDVPGEYFYLEVKVTKIR